MLNPVHFIALHWNETEPVVHFRAVAGEPAIEAMDLPISAPLTISLTETRLCIGYYDFVQKQRFVCPGQRPIKLPYVQCFACQRREVTYYTFTGSGADPEAAEKYLQTQTHYSYLAVFGRDLIKVGVASEGRRRRRTLEQGAVASLFFALANGNEIRELERAISRELKVRERITTLQKIKRLVSTASSAEASVILHDALRDIAAHVGLDLQAYLLPHADFHFLQEHYHLQLPPDAAHIHLIKRPVSNATYSGIVRGVVGNLLLLEALDQQLYVLPMKTLQGAVVTLAAHLRTMNLFDTPQTVAFER